jgi:glycosyltransferase involved in cell wall biosynthesis
MKLLFLLKNFHQGWGGAPESIRLMARLLRPHGVRSDVFDRGRLFRDVAALPVLPLRGAPAEAFAFEAVREYDAVLYTGPWQSFTATRHVLSYLRPGQLLLYLPRGGLADIEFHGRKGLKKLPYLVLLERQILARADAVIYSSKIEKVASARHIPRRAAGQIIPDFFDPLPGPEGRPSSRVTFSFLAEVSRRKGLLPFVEAFAAWVRERDLVEKVRLVVAGGARPDSAAYLARARLEAASLGDMMKFAGPLAHEQRAAFYAATDIFVAPSLFESYCLTALEALGAGCTLLVAPNIGVLEYIPAHERVTVLDDTTQGAIVAGLDRALDAHRRAGAQAHLEMRALAAQIITNINGQALERWREVLRF